MQARYSSATARRGRVSDVVREGPAGAAMITVIFADSQVVVSSGLRMLLESTGDFTVVAEAKDIGDARSLVARHRPAVLLLDLDGPGGPALKALATMRAESPDTQIVALSQQEDAGFVREALAAGAISYVPKLASREEFAEAVRRAARGEAQVNSRVRSWLASDSSRVARNRLTPREIDVLKQIARGHTNGEIAAQLGLSVRTVESHRAHIQQKLGRVTRSDLVAYALERGLVGSESEAEPRRRLGGNAGRSSDEGSTSG